MLYVTDVTAAIAFYAQAFRATLRWKIDHEGRAHVAELEVGGSLLRLHEETPIRRELSPDNLQGTTVVVHLLVQDADAYMVQAVAAGAIETSPMQDHDYGYRQGNLQDPFGHRWVLERIDDMYKVPLVP